MSQEDPLVGENEVGESLSIEERLMDFATSLNYLETDEMRDLRWEASSRRISDGEFIRFLTSYQDLAQLQVNNLAQDKPMVGEQAPLYEKGPMIFAGLELTLLHIHYMRKSEYFQESLNGVLDILDALLYDPSADHSLITLMIEELKVMFISKQV